MKDEGPWDSKPGDNDPGHRWGWPGRDAIIAVRVGPDNRVTDRMLITLKPISIGQRVVGLVRW
jgi:hypothetical protein